MSPAAAIEPARPALGVRYCTGGRYAGSQQAWEVGVDTTSCGSHTAEQDSALLKPHLWAVADRLQDCCR